MRYTIFGIKVLKNVVTELHTSGYGDGLYSWDTEWLYFKEPLADFITLEKAEEYHDALIRREFKPGYEPHKDRFSEYKEFEIFGIPLDPPIDF